MSDVTLPLRHVYGVEPSEALQPGEAGFGEQEALRELRQVLEAMPVLGPSSRAVEAVMARAFEPVLEGESDVETAVFEQSRQALDQIRRASPRASVLEAVLARAAEATALESVSLEAESSVEAAVLNQSLRALDRLERPAPPASVLEAVLARAAEPAPADVLEAESPVEAALFDQSLRALDRLGRSAPSASVLEAVMARAVDPALEGESDVESAVLDQSLRALDALHTPSPRASVLEAVLARAAEASDQQQADLDAASPVEAAVLDQSLQALDRVPRPSPDASALEAVLAFAAQAGVSDGLEAVRHLYADGPAVGGVEADVLGQSRAALERAFTSRPQPRPSALALEAVLARAAEASGLAAEPVLEVAPVEAALMAQSHRALDRLPRLGAPAASLDAIRIAAATASSEAAAALAPASTPAVALPPSSTRWWAGAGALVLAALVAVVLLPNALQSDGAQEVAALEDAFPAVALLDTAPTAEPVPADDVLEADSESAPATPSAASPLVASAAVSGFVPVNEVRSQAQTRSARSVPPPPSASAPSPAASSAAAPAWDAPDNVRALSMRLEELDLEDAIDWEEPAEVFGVPATRSRTATPGIQAVREGAAPAPVTIPDSTRQR